MVRNYVSEVVDEPAQTVNVPAQMQDTIGGAVPQLAMFPQFRGGHARPDSQNKESRPDQIPGVD